jgi:hypothetical protein
MKGPARAATRMELALTRTGTVTVTTRPMTRMTQRAMNPTMMNRVVVTMTRTGPAMMPVREFIWMRMKWNLSTLVARISDIWAVGV